VAKLRESPGIDDDSMASDAEISPSSVAAVLSLSLMAKGAVPSTSAGDAIMREWLRSGFDE